MVENPHGTSDEESNDDAPENEPDGWLSHVRLEGSEEMLPVVLFRRDGNDLIVRQKDPCDPEPERIPTYPGDRLLVMQAISHTSVNASEEIGDIASLLHSVRLVPDRREGSTIYARTLRIDEHDDGRRVHVEPGGTLTIEPGAFTLELDHIDQGEKPTESGYVPLTPILWTWLAVGPESDSKIRYLLSASRRLDTANLLMIEVKHRRDALDSGNGFGPFLRRQGFELIGLVESAVIALSRAVDMVRRAPDLIVSPVEVPVSVGRSAASLTAIRNAYEHIEDRALGHVHGSPDPVALSIFDFNTLVHENAIQYGRHRFDLGDELAEVVRDARAYLKACAADAAPGADPTMPAE